MTKKDNELSNIDEQSLKVYEEEYDAYGFEDVDQDDLIIPRIKIMQATSPDRKDKALGLSEGDIIDTLTKEKLGEDDYFVPVFMYKSNILWNPRSEGGWSCMSSDGVTGFPSDGSDPMLCGKTCKKCLFDNSKRGAEAVPECTPNLNFFGFLSPSFQPVILGFSKSNYREGKTLLSQATFARGPLWASGYKLVAKEKKDDSNEWYIINPVKKREKTTADEREFAEGLFKAYRHNKTIKQASVNAAQDITNVGEDVAEGEVEF